VSRRPTIRDVARVAGVATVTVSRVANDPALVSPTTRARVEQAMRDLGYVANAAARSMRTRLSRSIGCLVPDLVAYPNAAIAQAAERHLAAAGYSLLLTSSDYDPAAEIRALEALRTRQVDGLLLYVSDETDPALNRALARLDMPLLVLDRTLAVDADVLLSAHEPALQEAVRHLAGLGHRRLAIMLSGLRVRPVVERRRAFLRAVAEAGLDALAQRVVEVPPEDHHRLRAAQDLLAGPAAPTAVLVEGSRQVRAVLAAARGLGRSIPQELSLIALDASDIATVTTPELTTVTRDYERIGRVAAGLLLERLAAPGAPWRRVELESRVELRGSCGPVRGDWC
jgi:DNA-binding LacI/PurR family transcriptional regulator